MWKDELVEILFSSDPSKLNVKKAINLKYKNMPSFLYKYKDFNDKYSLELLKSNEMYLSRPTEFNDPFDCALKMATKDLPDDYIRNVLTESIIKRMKRQGYKVSNKELTKLKRKKDIVHSLAKFIVKKRAPPNIMIEDREKLIESEEKIFREGYIDPEFKKNIHVTCFTETYDSILMWSHYANNHEGFCVKYDFKELGLNNPVARFIFPVIYKDTLFDLKDYIPDSNKDFGNVLKNIWETLRLKRF
ncbi:DUF2971 domain-containing protein [Methanobacterium petrolearium]|uniref:DUF2971 domain-containing protein n=1 Tax=Methanobacterium petrolearium TaxID=710190 RepID=UPI0030815C4F|nr:hypothetical protein GCM10025861_07460 [Methanobacterium petrolearium]